jgi:hypothetical protein
MATVFDHLPPSAFWRSGVAEPGPFGLSGLFQPKFAVTRDMNIATAGSCFAQHVGRALRGAGLNVLDVEPAPPGLENPAAYGFGLYSARYGNIYTARQLAQLLQDTTTGHLRPQAIWHRDGRPYDALRPGIEPGGFASTHELQTLRAFHLHRLRDVFTRTDLFIFTLGLTEAWVDATGTTYPTAPGLIADPPPDHPITFHNFTYPEVMEDLTTTRDLLHAFNPQMRLLLTVSPVPLTATASGQHVLAATTASKATLRAAAQDFTNAHPNTDYVPSYEVITHPAARGRFFAPNLRSVTQEGVDLVMALFLHAHALAPVPDAPTTTPDTDPDALLCEEALAEAFLT